MGFPELRFFCKNQKNEIYNLGVVPEPPGLRKLRGGRIHTCLENKFRLDLIQGVELNHNWVTGEVGESVRWHVMEAFYVVFVLSFSTFDVD